MCESVGKRGLGSEGETGSGRPCRACGEPNDRYLNATGKLCSKCRVRKLAPAAAAARLLCGACGAPVVDGRCTRGAEECWERSQMQKRRDASKGTKLPQLAMAVAVEWRRWHHHPEQQLIRLELIDALHAMAEHIGYPAFGPGGEDLPVEDEEPEPEQRETAVDPADGLRKYVLGHRGIYPSRHAARVPIYGEPVEEPQQAPGEPMAPNGQPDSEMAAWPQTMRQLADEGPPSTACSGCGDWAWGELCDRCRRAG